MCFSTPKIQAAQGKKGLESRSNASTRTMADGEEEKPNIAADGKINLRVRSQNGEQVTFQAKPTTKLSKLMRAYCERQMVDYSSVVFSYDGQRLREDQTPGELDMEDNEYIDVLQHQVGGQ